MGISIKEVKEQMLQRLQLIFVILLLFAISREVRAVEVVIDNDDGAPNYVETGQWTTSALTGYQGGTYRFTTGVIGEPTCSATWTPDLPSSRLYEVYAVYRNGTNRTTNAQMTITHSSGTTIIYLNQYGTGDVVETLLGEFSFDAGSSGSVRMDNNGSTDVLIADAIIWRIPVDPSPKISDISRDPETVTQSHSVTVTATITDNIEVSSATLSYSVSPSGLSDNILAYDDGTHGDGVTGDFIYGATIPAQPDGSTVAYNYMAIDDLVQSTISITQYYAVGPLPIYLPDTVVDNDDGAPGYMETGQWTTSSSVGYEGGTYRYALASPGVPTSTANWTPDLPRSGVYKVYAAFARGENRPTKAPITINHTAGQAVVYLNQYGSAGIVKILLGEFPFNAGTGGSVQMDNSGDEGAYIADAMIWHLPSDLPPVISMVTRDPIIPNSSESVLVIARILDNVTVSSAILSYTVNSGTPVDVPAYDDGTHGDVNAGDNIYGATIPAMSNGSTVILSYSALDNLGQSSTSPTQRYVVGQETGNIYIVLSSDTSVWSVSGGYYGVANWDVFESQTGVLSQVYDYEFRNAHVDSLGRPFKITWFMHGGAWFTTAVNSTPISATYHIRKNWGDDIEAWGDALEYHFHHYIWDGDSWEMAPTFAETIWEYEWVMSQMMLDEYLFITSFRSGWNYMDDTYQQYLERWVPFRMEGVQPDWVPYHPSFEDYRLPGTMKGWEVRHHYTKSVSASIVDQIFNAAELGTDQVVCIWSHQNEPDFPNQIADVDQRFHEGQTNHPSVQFYYCSAKEAMHRWLENTSTTVPYLEVKSIVNEYNVNVTILTEDDIYQEQPWVAAKRYAGDCVRLDTTKTGAGIWEFSYSRQEYDHVSVGVSDIYGNEIIADVNDGSRRWSVQSEFARAQSYRVDYDTIPTLAMLKNINGTYVSYGTLTVDYQNEEDGTWKSITLEGNTPDGTSIQVRYKTADTQELLDVVPWSEYYTGSNLSLPPGLQPSWIRIEVTLQGTPTATPELDGLEVHYDTSFISTHCELWQLYE